MTPRRPWSTTELGRAKALALTMEVRDVAAELGRPYRAVESALRRAGVSVIRLRAWTPAEDAFLRETAGTRSPESIAATLERTAKNVRHRARVLGISIRRSGALHHGAKHSQETRDAYRRLREVGVSRHRAARTLGVPESTTLKWDPK